jgi:hypothetical protein
VFGDDDTARYAFTPNGPTPTALLPTDYVVTQDAPDEETHAGGVVPFVGANVSGTVPEPTSAAILAGASCLAGLRTRSRRGGRRGSRRRGANWSTA